MVGRMLGRTDAEPTGQGVEACVAQALDLGIETIVSSDLRRASGAAAAIGERLGLEIAIDPRWRELDFGDWDGLLADEIDPAALARFWNDPDAAPPPDGERWSALYDRVGKALDDIAPRTTLVVAHGGSIRAAVGLLCGFEQRQLWAFDLPCAALLSLRVWPDERPSAQIIGLWP
jgi:alpha-ribazole phosphatase